MFSDKRTKPRVPIKIPIKYSLAENEKEFETLDERKNRQKASHSLDLSLGGLYLVAEEVLKVGNILRLKIYLLSESVFISALAQVVWANQKGAGIRFLAMKDADVEALKDYIDKVD